jgi:hypothetical protein
MDILYLIIASVFFAGTAYVVAKLPDFEQRREP